MVFASDKKTHHPQIDTVGQTQLKILCICVNLPSEVSCFLCLTSTVHHAWENGC